MIGGRAVLQLAIAPAQKLGASFKKIKHQIYKDHPKGIIQCKQCLHMKRTAARISEFSDFRSLLSFYGHTTVRTVRYTAVSTVDVH